MWRYIKNTKLTTKILVALILGVLVGHFFPQFGASLKIVGDMFLRLIKMIIVPLIFSTLVVGIAGTGDFKKLGKLGAKSILWFECATTVALLVGLVVGNVFKPGLGVTVHAAATVGQDIANKHIDLGQFIVNVIPTNILDGMVRGDMLQIVLFSCFFGIAIAATGEKAKPLFRGCEALAQVMFKITNYVMDLAPLGVFALISYTVSKYGIEMLLPLGKLIFSLYFAIAVFLLIVVIIASIVVKVNFFHVFRALREPALLGFTTASSEAAMPRAMEKLEEFGVPKSIVSFVIPTGYSFNLDGSTLYCTLATLFIAQMFGVHLNMYQQAVMFGMFMLSSKGIAGVPGASLIVIAATAVYFGLPVEGIGIILGVDRIMDMARTFCNLMGNCIATVVVARWEHQLPRAVLVEAYKKQY
ncbi:MAG: cation:dicarboxylase symporter family transporter [Lentisphaerota bacterium]